MPLCVCAAGSDRDRWADSQRSHVFARCQRLCQEVWTCTLPQSGCWIAGSKPWPAVFLTPDKRSRKWRRLAGETEWHKHTLSDPALIFFAVLCNSLVYNTSVYPSLIFAASPLRILQRPKCSAALQLHQSGNNDFSASSRLQQPFKSCFDIFFSPFGTSRGWTKVNEHCWWSWTGLKSPSPIGGTLSFDWRCGLSPTAGAELNICSCHIQGRGAERRGTCNTKIRSEKWTLTFKRNACVTVHMVEAALWTASFIVSLSKRFFHVKLLLFVANVSPWSFLIYLLKIFV